MYRNSDIVKTPEAPPVNQRDVLEDVVDRSQSLDATTLVLPVPGQDGLAGPIARVGHTNRSVSDIDLFHASESVKEVLVLAKKIRADARHGGALHIAGAEYVTEPFL